MLTVWLTGVLAVALSFFLCWLVSLPLKNAAIIDLLWGPAFLLAGLGYAWAGNSSARFVVVLGLVGVWGARLAAHLFLRNRGQPEDRRYAAMRAKRGASFWWRSLYFVFGFQALLVSIVSLPLLALSTSDSPKQLLATDVLGGLLWLVGFLFEAVGDWQLSRFLKGKKAGQVMNRGLWRYTRHPNYFGDFLQHWAWWLIVVGALGASAWWTIIAPLVMSVLLMRVSGAGLLERDIAERRPAYRQYKRSTPAFFPWLPRKTVS